MVAIKNILLFVAAASALVIGKRDAATIQSDIATIDTNVKALTQAVTNYQGGVLGAFPILAAEQTLETSLKQATTDAKATSELSSADSATIGAAVDSLIPSIEASLAALKAKKANFATDGLTSIVQSNLASLKTLTDAFSDALIAITSSDYLATANAQKATIDADFQDAITYFAS